MKKIMYTGTCRIVRWTEEGHVLIEKLDGDAPGGQTEWSYANAFGRELKQGDVYDFSIDENWNRRFQFNAEKTK